MLVNTREQKASFMYIHVIVFFVFFSKHFFFINRADRDVTSPVLHENKVTFWPESDYSLPVVFTCIANNEHSEMRPVRASSSERVSNPHRVSLHVWNAQSLLGKGPAFSHFERTC